MSVSGISSTSFFDNSSQSVQNKQAQIQKEFQQLGQDLQSGNTSAAQSDFTTLQKLVPKLNSGSSPQSYDPLVKAFTQLGQDIQSGNTSAAQQDYAKIQQVFQNQAQQTQGHHHHHGGGSGPAVPAVQTGNLTSAQQVYSTSPQDLQSAENGGQVSPQSSANSTSVSVRA